jgi:hypothetical protein
MREEELYQEFLEGRALHLLPALFVGDLVIHRFVLEVESLHSENAYWHAFLRYKSGRGLDSFRTTERTTSVTTNSITTKILFNEPTVHPYSSDDSRT